MPPDDRVTTGRHCTTIFRETDSVFCLYGPWPTTIPQTQPKTRSDGILSLADDHIAYSRTTVEWMSDRAQHILHIIPIGGSTQTNTKILRIACKSGWWRVPLISLWVNYRMSMTERKHNISTSEERIEWQTEWRRESYQLWGRQDADSRGCEG